MITPHPHTANLQIAEETIHKLRTVEQTISAMEGLFITMSGSDLPAEIRITINEPIDSQTKEFKVHESAQQFFGGIVERVFISCPRNKEHTILTRPSPSTTHHILALLLADLQAERIELLHQLESINFTHAD